eukprot:Filipodium_phascolosomae@DN5913_c0_g1_i1.p1
MAALDCVKLRSFWPNSSDIQLVSVVIVAEALRGCKDSTDGSVSNPQMTKFGRDLAGFLFQLVRAGWQPLLATASVTALQPQQPQQQQPGGGSTSAQSVALICGVSLEYLYNQILKPDMLDLLERIRWLAARFMERGSLEEFQNEFCRQFLESFGAPSRIKVVGPPSTAENSHIRQ